MGVQDRKAREFQRRQEDILSAAVELFAGEDWQAVTIEQIAERAEIGKGTVYKHFASKDELYATLALDFHERLQRALQALPATPAAVERLRAIISTYWQLYAALPVGLWRVVEYTDRMEFLLRLPPSYQLRYQSLGGWFNRMATEALELGMQSGAFARKPLAQALFVAQSALMGAIRLRSTGCVPPQEESTYVDALVQFIRTGLEATA